MESLVSKSVAKVGCDPVLLGFFFFFFFMAKGRGGYGFDMDGR